MALLQFLLPIKYVCGNSFCLLSRGKGDPYPLTCFLFAFCVFLFHLAPTKRLLPSICCPREEPLVDAWTHGYFVIRKGEEGCKSDRVIELWKGGACSFSTSKFQAFQKVT